jgi:hypothetical protein
MSKLVQIAMQKKAAAQGAEFRDPNKKQTGSWIPGFDELKNNQNGLPGLFNPNTVNQMIVGDKLAKWDELRKSFLMRKLEELAEKDSVLNAPKKDVFDRDIEKSPEQKLEDRFNKHNIEAAHNAEKEAEASSNKDAAWSYGGATVGGGALGALIGGEGNRIKGALIGALLANAANFARRKYKYGKDVIA